MSGLPCLQGHSQLMAHLAKCPISPLLKLQTLHAIVPTGQLETTPLLTIDNQWRKEQSDNPVM